MSAEPMSYKIAADFILVVHVLWIAFIVLGFPLFLYLNSTKGRIIHLAALATMIVMQVTRTVCPLTHLEVYLKSKGSAEWVYPGQFMIEAAEKFIYVEDLTLEKISCATILYFVIVVLSFWFRPLKKKVPCEARPD
jgi:hypothetical protein